MCQLTGNLPVHDADACFIHMSRDHALANEFAQQLAEQSHLSIVSYPVISRRLDPSSPSLGDLLDRSASIVVFVGTESPWDEPDIRDTVWLRAAAHTLRLIFAQLPDSAHIIPPNTYRSLELRG